MRQFAILLLSVAALAATTELAAARDGCGSGWYYNGYRCVPMNNYAPGRYFGGPGFYYGGIRNVGNGIYRDPNGNLQCYRRGFTVQDGVCKPYRGY